MPTVTALRAGPPGGVLVELDGSPWRVLPVDVAVAAGLEAGLELDRPRLRTLRRELRRAQTLTVAARALERGDLSSWSLRRRLERAGVAPSAQAEAIAALERAGFVDDARLATTRAEALASRGSGNARIRWQLERKGLAAELVEAALESLEPEARRARRIVAARGRSARTARLLAGRGFGEDSIEAALEEIVAEEA